METKQAGSLANIILEHFLELFSYNGFSFRTAIVVERPGQTILYRKGVMCLLGTETRDEEERRNQKKSERFSSNSHGLVSFLMLYWLAHEGVSL